MVLIDYSHLQMRNLYIALGNARPKKKNGVFVTEDFIKMFYHQMLMSFNLISREFKDYGEVVVCIDARTYWRKDIYPAFKAHRKKDREESDIDFDEFFKYATEFISLLKTAFPYTVIEVDKSEADDIIGVLAKEYGRTEKVVAVSSDKDMKQILEDGAELYDPIKKKFIRMTPEEYKAWKFEHILCGDEGDNIPHIKRETIFTENYLKYLATEGIHLKDTKTQTICEQYNELSIAEHLFAKYDVWRETKKDGKFKDIYKPTPFGPAGAVKFIGNGKEDLAESLKSNTLYMKHFNRNKELVLNDYIPDYLRAEIIEEYKTVERTYNSKDMMSFFMKHGLTQHMMNITAFELQAQRMHPTTSSTDEWL